MAAGGSVRCRPMSSLPKPFAADAEAVVRRYDVAGDMILDIGPKSAAENLPICSKVCLGSVVYCPGLSACLSSIQFAGFAKALAEAIAQSKAFSVAGGGDTLAAFAKFGVTGRIGYISALSWAFFEFLEVRDCLP